MADDDTTPIALRKWLLRSSDNTTRLKSTTKRAVLKRLVAFICAAGLAWHLCTFENAADLRFFGGIADIGYFPHEKQNLFTPCEDKLIRDFEFVDASNNTKAIVEQVPCAASTLQDKIEAKPKCVNKSRLVGESIAFRRRAISTGGC